MSSRAMGSEGGVRGRRWVRANRDTGATDPDRAAEIAKLPGRATSPRRAGLRSSGGAPPLPGCRAGGAAAPRLPLALRASSGKTLEVRSPLTKTIWGAGSAAETPAAPAEEVALPAIQQIPSKGERWGDLAAKSNPPAPSGGAQRRG